VPNDARLYEVIPPTEFEANPRVADWYLAGVKSGSVLLFATTLALISNGCADASDPMSTEDGSASSDVSGATTQVESGNESSVDESTSDSTAGTTSTDTSDAAGTDESTDASSTTDATDTDPGPCEYPPGAVEPMALNEVLSPYSWPAAKRADGLTTPLDLVKAHCDSDEVIDWSPHEVLVFISIPAW